MKTATGRLDPEQLAEHLDGRGEAAAAVYVLALARELEVARGELGVLAAFARTIAGLTGNGKSDNNTLRRQAKEALDTLRVTGRCPVSPSRRHSARRAGASSLTRCRHCHAHLRR
ncbi:hypothetical protein AB0M58_13455 [Streptomyces bobili]|uniref:hypothetical protein n=1 Tax=Streptomyces bobili TaxID=67280 RepID=UPI0034149055